MKNLKTTLASLMLGLLFSGQTMAIEEPQYKVTLSEGSFEIRQYAPFLIAETLVEGDMDEASNKGFRLIADYIFGNNQVPHSLESSKISMTAPVTVEPLSKKIEMTAPVTLQSVSAASGVQTATKWRVHFVMPSQYTLANIPKPKNDAVTLKEVPGKTYAAHTYSGFNTLARVQSKIDDTLEWAQRKSLKVIGTPQLSRYDPPWTLPMFRRNEILLEVSPP
jgi:hypothetical protein